MAQPQRTTLALSRRGQLTLPATLRRRFGLREGSLVTVEERPSEIVLRPATVLELDVYSDKEIASWDREDRLRTGEREAIRRRFRKGR